MENEISRAQSGSIETKSGKYNISRTKIVLRHPKCPSRVQASSELTVALPALACMRHNARTLPRSLQLRVQPLQSPRNRSWTPHSAYPGTLEGKTMIETYGCGLSVGQNPACPTVRLHAEQLRPARTDSQSNLLGKACARLSRGGHTSTRGGTAS
jgi:hypothetical protein